MFFIALIYILYFIESISISASIVAYFHTPNIIGREEIQAEKMIFFILFACAARTLQYSLLILI